MLEEGIWTGEIHGPYGWEKSGVYMLEHGQIVGGNNRHYSTGNYSVSGNAYKAEMNVHYHGSPRAIFGETRKDFKIQVTGELNEGAITAKVVRSDRPQYVVDYRMIKRMDLPAE